MNTSGTTTTRNKLTMARIPTDLNEMLDEGEFLFYGDPVFDDAMLKAGFFEHGATRRGHRIVTDKAISVGFIGIVEELTGLTEQEQQEYYLIEIERTELKVLLSLAEKYGYTLQKKQ